MCNTKAYPTQQSSSPSRGIPCFHKWGDDDRVTAVNCFIRNAVNAVPKLACPESKGSKPTTGLKMLWVRNLFRGKSNYWQVSQEEVGRTLKLLSSNYGIIFEEFWRNL